MSTRTMLHTLVDPFAETLELPIPEELGVAADWERATLTERLRGQYQVVREIGRGGMGVVFLARDVALHRLVAIKVLRSEFAACGEHRERFRREARMTARLSHANIVPVHTFGEDGDLVYIVMKYVHGESLGDRMRRDGALGAGDARRMVRELAMALDHAHGEGVIHRDLKAENILIDRASGRPMITDFGVALLRSLDPNVGDTSRAFGTPHYMSPEQAAGELDIDGRSDLYSLGVLAYYMLSGVLPFDGLSFESLAAKHITERHAPLMDRMHGDELPADLAIAIDRCLEKDRSHRWRSARELADALSSRLTRKAGRARRWVESALTKKFVAELIIATTTFKTVMARWMAV